ncbi:MAG: DUF397 domain-containing protein [Pseudonocardia sp.]
MSVLYRKSSFSQLQCVEVAQLPDGTVAVRDSKDVDKPAHEFTAAEWAAFVAGVKEGEFDFGPDPAPR